MNVQFRVGFYNFKSDYVNYENNYVVSPFELEFSSQNTVTEDKYFGDYIKCSQWTDKVKFPLNLKELVDKKITFRFYNPNTSSCGVFIERNSTHTDCSSIAPGYSNIEITVLDTDEYFILEPSSFINIKIYVNYTNYVETDNFEIINENSDISVNMNNRVSSTIGNTIYSTSLKHREVVNTNELILKRNRYKQIEDLIDFARLNKLQVEVVLTSGETAGNTMAGLQEDIKTIGILTNLEQSEITGIYKYIKFSYIKKESNTYE